MQWLCPHVPKEKIQANIKPRADPKRATKYHVCREASLREQGTWTGGSTRQREACPHLEAKATLDTLRDALMLSQLTTKHCIPKGGKQQAQGRGPDCECRECVHHPSTSVELKRCFTSVNSTLLLDSSWSQLILSSRPTVILVMLGLVHF